MAIASVQTPGTNTGSGTGGTVSLPGNSTTGSLLVIAVECDGAIYLNSVSGAGVTTWNDHNAFIDGSRVLEIRSGVVDTTVGTTVTFGFDDTSSGWTAVLFEFTGINTGDAFEGFTTEYIAGPQGTLSFTTDLTTTVADSLLVFRMVNVGDATAKGAPWVSVTGHAGGGSICAYRILTSTGTFDYDTTGTDIEDCNMLMASFNGTTGTPTAAIAAYNSFKETVGDGTIDLDTHTLKGCAVTSSYTPSAAHTQLSDVSTNRVSGTSDTALTTVTWAQTSGVAKLDADDLIIQFPSGGTPKYVVIYDDTATNDDLIAYLTLPDSTTIDAGSSLKLVWDAAGIVTLD